MAAIAVQTEFSANQRPVKAMYVIHDLNTWICLPGQIRMHKLNDSKFESLACHYQRQNSR
jgi:hypothetical protein